MLLKLNNKLKNKKGFAIIEVIIAFALIAIVSATTIYFVYMAMDNKYVLSDEFYAKNNANISLECFKLSENKSEFIKTLGAEIGKSEDEIKNNIQDKNVTVGAESYTVEDKIQVKTVSVDAENKKITLKSSNGTEIITLTYSDDAAFNGAVDGIKRDDNITFLAENYYIESICTYACRGGGNSNKTKFWRNIIFNFSNNTAETTGEYTCEGTGNKSVTQYDYFFNTDSGYWQTDTPTNSSPLLEKFDTAKKLLNTENTVIQDICTVSFWGTKTYKSHYLSDCGGENKSSLVFTSGEYEYKTPVTIKHVVKNADGTIKLQDENGNKLFSGTTSDFDNSNLNNCVGGSESIKPSKYITKSSENKTITKIESTYDSSNKDKPWKLVGYDANGNEYFTVNVTQSNRDTIVSGFDASYKYNGNEVKTGKEYKYIISYVVEGIFKDTTYYLKADGKSTTNKTELSEDEYNAVISNYHIQDNGTYVKYTIDEEITIYDKSSNKWTAKYVSGTDLWGNTTYRYLYKNGSWKTSEPNKNNCFAKESDVISKLNSSQNVYKNNDKYYYYKTDGYTYNVNTISYSTIYYLNGNGTYYYSPDNDNFSTTKTTISDYNTAIKGVENNPNTVTTYESNGSNVYYKIDKIDVDEQNLTLTIHSSIYKGDNQVITWEQTKTFDSIDLLNEGRTVLSDTYGGLGDYISPEEYGNSYEIHRYLGSAKKYSDENGKYYVGFYDKLGDVIYAFEVDASTQSEKWTEYIANKNDIFTKIKDTEYNYTVADVVPIIRTNGTTISLVREKDGGYDAIFEVTYTDAEFNNIVSNSGGLFKADGKSYNIFVADIGNGYTIISVSDFTRRGFISFVVTNWNDKEEKNKENIKNMICNKFTELTTGTITDEGFINYIKGSNIGLNVEYTTGYYWKG